MYRSKVRDIVLVVTALSGCAGSALPPEKRADMPEPVSEVRSEPTSIRETSRTSDPFGMIDEHVARIPADAETSIQSLVKYLIEPASGEREKARAIFRWVATNIEYDWEGYQTSNYADTSPDGVLRNRKSVCDGYASLIERLGKEAGLEIVSIDGYAKGYNYFPGMEVTSGVPNHAWNAVRIDGEWHLMDPTWGAGYISTRENEYVQRFEEHYFLTPPELFVADHLPTDPRWQLLDPPVTREEYERLAYVRPAAFSTGLRLLSHPDGWITTDGELTVSFSRPDSLAVSARISRNEMGDLPRRFAFVQGEGDIVRVQAQFPEEGYYTLLVFVRRNAAEQRYAWAVEYTIECTADRPELSGFPEQFGTFLDTGCRLNGPLRGTLRPGSTETFSIRVPGAEAVAVVVDGDWNHLTGTGSLFEGRVTLGSGGTATVYAKRPGDTTYHGLLAYRVGQ